MKNEDMEILNALGSLASDPVAFVYFAFDWESEELKGQQPQAWQIKTLKEVGRGLSLSTALQHATASGHGIASIRHVRSCPS